MPDYYEDDYYDDEYDTCCHLCGGEGWIVTCCDDICQGQGWCMHGDGDEPCPECDNSEINPFPSALPRYAIENGWTPRGEESGNEQ